MRMITTLFILNQIGECSTLQHAVQKKLHYFKSTSYFQSTPTVPNVPVTHESLNEALHWASSGLLDDKIKALPIIQHAAATAPMLWHTVGTLLEEFQNFNESIYAHEELLKATGTSDLSPGFDCDWDVDSNSKVGLVRQASYRSLVDLHLQTGDFLKAAEVCQRLLSERQSDYTSWLLYGTVLRAASLFESALPYFQKAVELSNGEDADPISNLAYAYSMLPGRQEDAISLYELAQTIDDSDRFVAQNLALLYMDKGNIEKAQSLVQRLDEIEYGVSSGIATDSVDDGRVQAEYLLAGLQTELGKATSGATEKYMSAPAVYVERLFDGYARLGYEEHMLTALGYQGPTQLWRLYLQSIEIEKVNRPTGMPPLLDDREVNLKLLIDLGCGTGLVGEAFKRNGFEGVVKGCDLSGVMINDASVKTLPKAQAKDTQIPGLDGLDRVYESVFKIDCVEFLKGFTEEIADVITAADVLVYMGRLEELFAQIGRVLKSRGLFLFTVEATDSNIGDNSDEYLSKITINEPGNITNYDGPSYRLQSSGRFQHDVRYVRKLVNDENLELLIIERASVRSSGGVPVNSLLIAVLKP